eukprot:scaffold22642_cov134-Cylindrotheca_fusiformis.AAC.41
MTCGVDSRGHEDLNWFDRIIDFRSLAVVRGFLASQDIREWRLVKRTDWLRNLAVVCDNNKRHYHFDTSTIYIPLWFRMSNGAMD